MARPSLSTYDPAWSGHYEAEAAAISAAFGDLAVEIEHVGSTAVPGLAAKPTIDMAVGLMTLDLPPEVVASMGALGYEDCEAESRAGERRFRRGNGVPRTFVVHAVEWGSASWLDYLRFRDALRADPELAREYEALKRSLLDGRGDRYCDAEKRALIERVLASAPARAAVIAASPDGTEAVGARVADRLEVGDVVTVSGELGSGKTTFVRGACRALGVTQAVTSPTFTIGHRYPGRLPVAHLDLYRFASVSAAEWGDLEPYFDGSVVFVEWPEAAGEELPAPRVSARLRHRDLAHRLIELESREKSLLERVFSSADTSV